MKTSQLIAALQADLAANGDLECFTNGEHGTNDPKQLSQGLISSGAAALEIDEHEKFNLAADEVILFIGGY